MTKVILFHPLLNCTFAYRFVLLSEAPNVNSGSDMDLEEEEGAQEAKNTAISVDAISSADDEPSEEGESPASDVRDVVVGEKRKRA